MITSINFIYSVYGLYSVYGIYPVYGRMSAVFNHSLIIKFTTSSFIVVSRILAMSGRYSVYGIWS
ncbi:hypothetical protein ACUTD3_19670, partial [Acinetobacter baumannii]